MKRRPSPEILEWALGMSRIASAALHASNDRPTSIVLGPIDTQHMLSLLEALLRGQMVRQALEALVYLADELEQLRTAAREAAEILRLEGAHSEAAALERVIDPTADPPTDGAEYFRRKPIE